MSDKELLAELEEARDWLNDQIDGGDECLGRDQIVSGHIRAVDAAMQRIEQGAKDAEDAKRWKDYKKVVAASRTLGGLLIRLMIQPEAFGVDKVWCNEFVIGTAEMNDGPIRNRIIGMHTASMAEKLFAAIAAEKGEGNE